MILIPNTKPVVQNLNSYYINARRFIEHYQGELGTGGIHLKGHSAEGWLFFDDAHLLSGIFQDKDSLFEGREAVQRILDAIAQFNFVVAVYKIPLDKIYYWSNLHHSEEVYKDLSTEFTDLEGLIKKMMAEKLTGFIDVVIGNGEERGRLFFNLGKVVGTSHSGQGSTLDLSKESLDRLVRLSRKNGGILNVRRIAQRTGESGAAAAEAGGVPDTAKAEKKAIVAQTPAKAANSLQMIEELLSTLEETIKASKKIKHDFATLLKKKFVDKADTYDFLDPFADEFSYTDGSVRFEGTADESRMAKGVMESVGEIADELGIASELRQNLAGWQRKYASILSEHELSI